MLQNAYFLAKIGADTAENEQHCAEICRDHDADGAFFDSLVASGVDFSPAAVRRAQELRLPLLGALSEGHAGIEFPCECRMSNSTFDIRHASISVEFHQWVQRDLFCERALSYTWPPYFHFSYQPPGSPRRR